MALREILVHFGFDFDKSGHEKADHAVKKTKHEAEEGAKGFAVLVEAARALAAVELARQAAEWVEGIVSTATALEHTAAATGLSTDELQEWNLGAKEAGISGEEFTLSLRKLSSAIAGGADEAGTQGKVFAKLKIQTKDAAGNVRSLSDILPEIAEHFHNTADGAGKAALAQELFGRQGARLIPLLNKGSEGIQELHKDFEELGGGFRPEAIERAAEFEKQTARLSVAFDGLKSRLAVALLPKITNLLEISSKLVARFGEWASATTLLESGVGSLSTAIGIALWGALSPFLGPALEFVAIFLAIDDLKAFLNEQGSVIGDILDGWFGDGTADVVRLWIEDAKAYFVNGFKDIQAVFPIFYNAFAGTMDQIELSMDQTVLSLKQKWNGLIDSLGLKDSFKIDTSANESQVASLRKSRDAHADKQFAASQALTGYISATTPTSGSVATQQGPLRAPVEYHNSVELKPQITVQVAPGTAQKQAAQIARVTADAVSENYRSALQDLQAAVAGQGT